MKRTSLIATILLITAGITVQAQDTGNKAANKAQKDKKEKVEKRANADADTLKQAKGKSKDRKQAGENSGNAYGKDKGEMTGREFGQARAAAARNLKTQIDSLEHKVKRGESLTEKARADIEEAEEALEERDADDEDRSKRWDRIERAKAQLTELEAMIQSEKARLNKAREKLSEVTLGRPEISPAGSSDTDPQDMDETEDEDESGDGEKAEA